MRLYLILRKGDDPRGYAFAALELVDVDILYPRGVARAVVYMDEACGLLVLEYDKQLVMPVRPLLERLFCCLDSVLVRHVGAEMKPRAEAEITRNSVNGLIFILSAEFLELCHNKTSFLTDGFIIAYLFPREKQKTLPIKKSA